MKCNLCGGENNRLLFEKNSGRLLQCNGCGLKFVENPPDREEARALYGKDYFSAYRQNKYGYEDYLAHKYLYLDMFLRRLEVIEKYKRGGRLLDVGCATGVLIDVARFRGWEVQGVDISPYASEIARKYYNLDVFTGTLEEAGYEDARFDLIYMHDLIEHVPDPMSLVKEARRILKPDGLLAINTPNAGGFLARVLGKRWFHYKLQTHVALFSPKTLGALLDRAGFRVLNTVVTSRVINLEYLVERMKYDMPPAAALLGFFSRGGAISKITFPFWSGEFEAYAVKKDSSR